MKSAWRWSLPFLVFAALAVFLYTGLFRDPREVPSPLIGKPAPAFALRDLHEPGRTFGTTDMRGQVWLLNVWASWCESCRIEHPLLVDLARQKIVPIVGLDYKDQDDLGKKWLADRGNPYSVSIVDGDGRVGIDWGVYGVPETYLIDAQGVIRYKQIGPLTPQILEGKLLPLARSLKR